MEWVIRKICTLFSAQNSIFITYAYTEKQSDNRRFLEEFKIDENLYSSLSEAYPK